MFGRWFPHGSMRQLVATNTASQLVGRIISTVVMTVVSLLIARQYGADGYGDFVKITTYVGFFYLLADFGLNAVYIQGSLSVHDERIAARSWQQLLGLRLVMSVLLMSIAYVILLWLPRGTNQGYTPLVRLGILFLIPVIVAQAVTTTTNAWFQKLLRYDFAAAAQNAGSLATLLLAVVLSVATSANGSLVGVAAIFLGSIMTAVLALYFVRLLRGTIMPIFHIRSMITDLATGFPLGLTLVFNLIYFHSDSVILTLTRSTQEVGMYGLAYKVFELPLVLPLFFMNAVYPLMLKANREDPRASSVIFWRSLWFLLIGSVCIGAALWVLAPLATVIRPEFAQSIIPLRILVLGLPVFFVSSLFMWVLIAQKRQWILLGIHAGAMICNITLNILFIPRYGYLGAAWITGISEVLILTASAICIGQQHLVAWRKE